jgi:DnaD/phage-associated family protein
VTFAGFPARPQSTAIPNVFFSDVLPRLTDPVALGIALFAFCALARKKGYPRYVSADDIVAEPGLPAFLRAAGRDADAAAVSAGLARSVELGTLLALSVERDGARRELYFLNSPADRRGMEAVRSGAIDLGRVAPAPASPAPERPGVFALYESLIGTLSPLVVDELTEAEKLYPAAWIESAFREAAAQNARSWRYVSRILERWAIEGPDHATAERDPAGEGRYLGGKYGRILKQRIGR